MAQRVSKDPFEADKAGLSKDYKTGGKAWDRGLSMETCGARKRGRLPRGGDMFKSPIPEEQTGGNVHKHRNRKVDVRELLRSSAWLGIECLGRKAGW